MKVPTMQLKEVEAPWTRGRRQFNDWAARKQAEAEAQKVKEFEDAARKAAEIAASAPQPIGNPAAPAETAALLSRLEILENAQSAGDLKTALLGIREARSCLELCMKAEGQIKDTQITIINDPEWVELRTLVINALEPYPEAREAVVHAIRK